MKNNHNFKDYRTNEVKAIADMPFIFDLKVLNFWRHNITKISKNSNKFKKNRLGVFIKTDRNVVKPDFCTITVLQYFCEIFRTKELYDEDKNLIGFSNCFETNHKVESPINKKIYLHQGYHLNYSNLQNSLHFWKLEDIKESTKKLKKLGLLKIEYLTLFYRNTKIGSQVFITLMPEALKNYSTKLMDNNFK